MGAAATRHGPPRRGAGRVDDSSAADARRGRSRARACRDRRVAARGGERPAADRLRHRRGRDRQDDARRHRAPRPARDAPERELRIARGQCVEHYGGGEPYLPVLERSGCARAAAPTGRRVGATLRDHAPGWLLARHGLRRHAERRSRATTAGGTHEHTLHRLAASLDALAADTPLVLVLEDVQWSDYSTLDLLSVLAQRREPARLLVLCTLRPADAIVRGHPVAERQARAAAQGALPRDPARRALGGGRRELSRGPLPRRRAARRPAAAARRSQRRQPVLPRGARRSPARAAVCS